MTICKILSDNISKGFVISGLYALIREKDNFLQTNVMIQFGTPRRINENDREMLSDEIKQIRNLIIKIQNAKA